MSLEMLPAFVIGALCSGVAMLMYMRQENEKKLREIVQQQGRRASDSKTATGADQKDAIKKLEKERDESVAQVQELRETILANDKKFSLLKQRNEELDSQAKSASDTIAQLKRSLAEQQNLNEELSRKAKASIPSSLIQQELKQINMKEMTDLLGKLESFKSL